jgi:hypothetical protein
MQNIGEGDTELSQLLILTSPKLRPQRQRQPRNQSQPQSQPRNPSRNPLPSLNRHRKPKESIKDFSQSPLFGGFFLFLGVIHYR